MLHPFIIEQIRQREEEERRQRERHQPRVEIPLDIYQPASSPGDDEDEADRGVTILDLG
jgi:hypothetical protein